jgi:hypothetical protein
MRIGKSIETIPVLVATGVKETFHKLVLGYRPGIKNRPPIGMIFALNKREERP